MCLHRFCPHGRIGVMLDALSTLDDENLAQRVACRDGSAADRAVAVSSYEELYRRHARQLLAFLAARCSAADREDLLQRVWLKVWEKPNFLSASKGTQK